MRRRVLVAVLSAAAVAYAAWLLLLFVQQRAIIYPRRHAVADERVAARIPGLERWWRELPEGGGRVEAWFVPGAGVSPERPGPAVVFGHGNAETIDSAMPGLLEYVRLGVSVLAVEYRGYARSGGEPTQEGIVSDFAHFAERLVARPEVDPARLVYHGRSLGGGPVCQLAASRPPAALILQSTFRSARSMATAMGAPGFLVKDPWDSDDVLARLDRPVLLLHGRRDGTIPFSHGEALHAVAPRSRLVAYDCDHNDLPPDPAHYWAEIASHLRDAGVLTGP